MTPTPPVPSTTPGGVAVSEALRALPDGHRQALLMSHAGLTYFQVADALGLPVEKVRIAVLHAVMALTRARLAAAPRPRTLTVD